MPPTVETVEQATELLKESAAGFDVDPKCKESMGKLLQGSRGVWREAKKICVEFLLSFLCTFAFV